MDVEQVTGELYGLRPSEFTAARDAYAAEARRAKDTAAAKAIAALRRPPLAVWAANLLARERPEDAERFLALGEALRAAHRTLDGERLREASRQQHRLVAALVRTATGLAEEAGQPVSDTVLGDVERILHAVLALPEVAGPWAKGRLAAMPETAVGFPAVPSETLTTLTTRTPASPAEKKPAAPAETKKAQRARKAQKAQKAEEAREAGAAKEAEAKAEEARAALARRERDRDAARETERAATAAAEEAADRLRRAEREREEARTAAAAAEKTAKRAATDLRAAERALEKARSAAEAAEKTA
ncbi:hypothetical protein [Streptomyces sp. NRRL F-5727]|uniref:hypothetical protein n=1 Tax=Streptomyces sp. NRRL F-5727 TaxID=1463871 RepID=UPI0004C81606|nr:hypothetical protein [Streptomyces sp. NRRL F-5727]